MVTLLQHGSLDISMVAPLLGVTFTVDVMVGVLDTSLVVGEACAAASLIGVQRWELRGPWRGMRLPIPAEERPRSAELTSAKVLPAGSLGQRA